MHNIFRLQRQPKCQRRICVRIIYWHIGGPAALINRKRLPVRPLSQPCCTLIATDLIEPDNLLRERGTDLDCGASSTPHTPARCWISSLRCVVLCVCEGIDDYGKEKKMEKKKHVAISRQADLFSLFAASHTWQIEQIYKTDRRRATAAAAAATE